MFSVEILNAIVNYDRWHNSRKRMVCVIEHSTLLIFKFHHTDNEGNLPMKRKICLIRTQYKKSAEKKKVKKKKKKRQFRQRPNLHFHFDRCLFYNTCYADFEVACQFVNFVLLIQERKIMRIIKSNVSLMHRCPAFRWFKVCQSTSENCSLDGT